MIRELYRTVTSHVQPVFSIIDYQYLVLDNYFSQAFASNSIVFNNIFSF